MEFMSWTIISRRELHQPRAHMRVVIGEEVIKGVANEIGFISTEGNRGRSVFVARTAR